MNLKKISQRIIFSAICLAFIIVVMPAALFAQGTGGVSFSSGTPEFNFQIPIGVLKSLTLCETKGGVLSCPGIAKYVQVAYTFLVGFAAVLAVLAITWGGVQWLISRGESGKIQEARKIIGNAVVGLIIALLSYAGLYLINPDLTQFNPLTVKPITPIELETLGELAAIGGSRDEVAYAVPVTGCPNNPTVSYLGKAYTKNMFGDVWADTLCRKKQSYFLVNKKTGKPAYDAITDVHETTHGINSLSGKFYIGNGDFVYSRESTKTTLDDVAERLSPKLQQGNKVLFETYIDTKYKGKDKWDEGVAKQNKYEPVDGVFADFSCYTMGVKALVEIYEKNLPGKQMEEVTGAAHYGTSAFAAYGLALAQALEDKEPSYLKDGTFKKALKQLIEAGRKADQRAAAIGIPGESKAMYDTLRTDADPKAQKLRDLAKLWYGDAWTREWLEF